MPFPAFSRPEHLHLCQVKRERSDLLVQFGDAIRNKNRKAFKKSALFWELPREHQKWENPPGKECGTRSWRVGRLVGWLGWLHQANNEGWEKQRLETPKWAQEAICHLQDVVKLKNSLLFFTNQGHILVGNNLSQVLPPWFKLGHSAYRKASSCVPFSVMGGQ